MKASSNHRRLFIPFLLSFLFASLLMEPQGICRDDSLPGHDQAASGAEAEGGSGRINLGASLVSLFRDHLSSVDGDRCPSVPTCASYSVLAFEKHGFIVGWLMTVDRLIHEADEGTVSPLVYHQGRVKILDPVENNDFWWFGAHGRNQD